MEEERGRTRVRRRREGDMGKEEGKGWEVREEGRKQGRKRIERR
jgi:hypothetical protein